MKTYFLKIYQRQCIVIFFVLSHALLAWSFDIPLKDMKSIEQVKEKVLLRADDIYKESVNAKPLMKLHNIMKDKIRISSEFEKRFNNNKSRIYQLNNEIFQLNKIKDFMKKLERLKENQLELKIDYNMKVQHLNDIYKDEYIPGIFVWNLKIPTDEERVKDQLVRSEILRTMIENYGIEKFFASTRIENGIIQNMIQSRTFGKIEEDGIRNYDGKMVVDRSSNNDINLTQYFSLSFFRFKPFFSVPDSDFKQTNRQRMDQNYYFKSWDLSEMNALSNAILEVQSQISYNIHNDVSNFQNYVLSLGNIAELVSSAQERIQTIVTHFQELETKFQDEYHFNNIHIERFEMKIAEILNQLNLNLQATQKDIDQYVNERKEIKTSLENNFEYQFVIKESVKAAYFDTAIRHTIENGFARIAKMIHQQAMSIECIVNDGNLQEITEKSLLIKPCFEQARVKPFVDQGEAGVMIVLSVRYETASHKRKIKKDEDEDEIDPHKRKKKNIDLAHLPENYIENIMDLNIHMNLVKSGKQLFYISKSEITIKQFMIFIKDTKSNIKEFVTNSYCLKRISSHKDHYPMRCVNSNGMKAFLNWLEKKSDRKYSLPDQSQKLIDERYKLNKGNGFKVVVNLR